jgi:hypothetical protein
MDSCFFCHPDEERILFRAKHFYAMLGLGPIVDGYCILVAKDHVRSMRDLAPSLRKSYLSSKNALRTLIEECYGPTIITEHGRIETCLIEDEEEHEHHCYHAHQLFFPVDVPLQDELSRWPFDLLYSGTNLFAAGVDGADHEYLMFEATDGQVYYYKVNGKCPRQFMRYLIAQHIGHPELANWKNYPGWEGVKRARVHLSSLRRLVAPTDLH